MAEQQLSLLVQLLLFERWVVMSKSRLKTVTSRSFLNQPIQYRQVIHNRSGHSTVNTPHLSSQLKPGISTKRDTESKLEQILKQRSERTSRNISYSLSMDKGISNKDSVRLDLPAVHKHKQNQAKQMEQTLTTPQQKHDSYLESPSMIDERLEEIDARLEKIVNHKLKLVLQETSNKRDLSESVARVTSEGVNGELQQLLYDIRALKNTGSSNDFNLLNNKIRFIETLLAEQITEAELMKKYYFTLNSKKKKGKIGAFNHIKHRIGNVYWKQQGQRKDRKSNHSQGVSHTKALFNDTTSRSAYRQPKPEDYESYRYKHKMVALNMQPLPRSSYKRQFLYQQSSPDKKIVNRDHSPYNPHCKSPLASIYEKDYRSLKTDTVNYRDLDAYKNKIRVLRVNYMPKNRMETVHVDRSAYEKDVEMSSSRLRSPPPFRHHSEQEIIFNKNAHKSEAQRQFRAQLKHQPSRIKHQQLLDAQYKLKKLFKA